MRYGLAGAIGLYQRHLSPLKGFCCAHHVLHARGSCSAFGKRLALRSGVWRFLALMPLRFNACRKASMRLATENEAKPGKPSSHEMDDKSALFCLGDAAQAACCLIGTSF